MDKKKTAEIISLLYKHGGYSFYGEFCRGGQRSLSHDEFSRLIAAAQDSPNIIHETRLILSLIDSVSFNETPQILSDHDYIVAEKLLSRRRSVVDISQDTYLMISNCMIATISDKRAVESYHSRRCASNRHISKRSVRKRIFERDGYKCKECKAVDNLSIDHIIPVSKFGTDDDSNLQLLCRSCNSSKGAK